VDLCAAYLRRLIDLAHGAAFAIKVEINARKYVIGRA
jgi:hypothetical protein